MYTVETEYYMNIPGAIHFSRAAMTYSLYGPRDVTLRNRATALSHILCVGRTLRTMPRILRVRRWAEVG